METATRNLDIVTRFKGGEQVKAGFDAEKISAKDLQERIADLDTRMKKLTDTYGKQAYASKAGVIVQRERKLALEQLINLEEKQNIVMGKSTRGLGSLASAMISANGSISGLGTGVSVLSNALMSGVGLTGALAAVTIGFSLLMESIRGAREEQEKLNKEIAGFIKVNMPEGSFNINPANIKQTIAYIKAQMQIEKQLDVPQVQGFGGMPVAVESSQLQERNKIYETTITILEKAQEEYDRYLKIVGVLSSAGMGFTAVEEKKNKEIKKTINNWDILSASYERLINAISTQQRLTTIGKGTKLGGTLGMGFVSVPEKPEPIVTFSQKELEDQFGLYADLIRDTANVFRSEFGSAWEDVFGEANSMFEKLIASWAQTLFEKLSGKALGGLLSLIPGGSVIGDLLGFSKAVNTANNYNSKLRID